DGATNQRRRRGAIIRQPVTSPNHHVSQTTPYWLQLAKSPKVILVTPRVAAIIELSTTMRANLTTSWARSKARVPLANLLTSQAPQIASRVLPVAMPNEIGK